MLSIRTLLLAASLAAGLALPTAAQAQLAQAQLVSAPQAAAKSMGRYVGEREVALRLADAVRQRNGGKPVEIHFHGRDNGFMLPQDAAWRLDQFNYDARSGRFSAQVAAAGLREEIRLSGRAESVEALPVLRNRVAPGETISAADLEWRQMPAGRYGSDYIERMEDAIGQAPKRSLGMGQPIRAADLSRPEAVSKNTLVTMIASVPGLTITTTGRAIEGGAIGDVIQVTNTQSKRIVQATIVAPNQVQVISAPRVIASN